MAYALHLAPSKALREMVTPLKANEARPLSVAKLVEFKRHDHLPTRNNAAWRIHSGYVRTLSWNKEGDPIPLGFWGAGDVISEAIAQTSPCEAHCLGLVTAEALGHGYAFSRDAVMAQVRQSNELLKIAHSRQTENRLLRFLCWLANRFGRPTQAGLEIPLRLIHQDIAEAVGATRVTITRLLKKLESEQKIRWSMHEKVICASALAHFTFDVDYPLGLTV